MGLKQRVVGITGSISGVTSILGSWQVCHTICLGLIGALSLIGITISGMPLFFLTTIAIPIWSVAAFLLAITIYLHVRKKCLPHSLLLFNTGILIAGIPFASLSQSRPFFWAMGGLIAAGGVALFIRQKMTKNKSGEKTW